MRCRKQPIPPLTPATPLPRPSPQACELIRGLLTTDPSKRFTVKVRLRPHRAPHACPYQ